MQAPFSFQGSHPLPSLPPTHALRHPPLLQACNNASMLAGDGRCKTLDAAADGYVRAEAVGGLMLRPLGSAAAGGVAMVSSELLPCRRTGSRRGTRRACSACCWLGLLQANTASHHV